MTPSYTELVIIIGIVSWIVGKFVWEIGKLI